MDVKTVISDASDECRFQIDSKGRGIDHCWFQLILIASAAIWAVGCESSDIQRAQPKGTLAGGVDASYFVDIDGALFVTERSAMIEKGRRDGTLKAQDPTVKIIRFDNTDAVVEIDGETLDARRMQPTTK
ncbi:MAG: hypothetical protein JWP89_2455 [Schlesneria sp.]|nr:hypothetical protein [Schlesneria sp.]